MAAKLKIKDNKSLDAFAIIVDINKLALPAFVWVLRSDYRGKFFCRRASSNLLGRSWTRPS
jgi:hypothetical protein